MAEESLPGDTPKWIKTLTLWSKLVAAVGVGVGLVASGVLVYRMFYPVPTQTIGKIEMVDEPVEGRSPCEVLALRGLACSADGLLGVLGAGMVDQIPLYVEAGIDGNAIGKIASGSEFPVWVIAEAQDLPGLRVLLEQMAQRGTNLRVPRNDHCRLADEPDCSPVLYLLEGKSSSDFFCQIARLDPHHDKFFGSIAEGVRKYEATPRPKELSDFRNPFEDVVVVFHRYLEAKARC